MKFDIRTYNGWNSKDGRHSVELVMAVIGTEGAMVWRLALGITPLGHFNYTTEPNITSLYNVYTSSPHDMGLAAHSELNERTMHDSESFVTDSCEFLEGRACVCDYHTGLAGSRLLPAFACEGFDGVRKVLEEEYTKHYGKDS